MSWLYAVVPRDSAVPGLRGIDGAVVTLVASGTLAVAISAADNTVQPSAARLRQHHHVSLALLAAGPVAPFRFGQIVADDQVAGYIDRERGRLEASLAAIGDAVEMKLRLPAQTEQTPTDGLSGRNYLESKRRKWALLERLKAGLAGTVTGWREREQQGRLTIACLVERQQVEPLRQRVAQIDPAVTVSGPWAPASFV